ncbi:MAG: 16S rRNA (cytosine(967)-C(5))-methyltransferase RsmB [Gammaproteobacteria bacterium]|nr:16S rRNA (cytosine(967)-C(5))-methyltransferase RsmB [Gammaproteobacteria bacterium]
MRGGAGAAVLAAAARAVAAVVSGGRSADAALAGAASEQRAAIRAVALGTLRHFLRCEPLLGALLSDGGAGCAAELHALLACALHQLEHSRNPREATVSQAVDAARLLRQGRAAGLVNAVLRRYLRERAALLAAADADPAVAAAHPRWLYEAIAAAWPDDLAAVVAANNAHPPLTLRVDRTRGSVADYLVELAAADLPARALPPVSTAVLLERPVPVARLPGFAAGRVSVQDAHAQLAAPLLDPQPGERVLDACAAPGGKSLALLEHAGGALDLTALDVDAARAELIDANLRRAGRAAQVVVADVTAAPDWWDGRPFDRILLDAPCSASGVLRRHPDIRVLRRASDIVAFTERQQRALAASFALLRVGGRLLYATCSILPAENAAVIEAFVAAEPAAQVVPLPAALLPASIRRPAGAGVQLLPGGEACGDGFYYACLTRHERRRT